MVRTILAVDGGNSKTDVAVVSEDGEVLSTGRSGPFVPQSAGVTAAVDTAMQAVRQAASDPGPFAHVAAYLAGADLPVEEEELAREFGTRGLGGDIVVRNDTFALLRAGASGPWGVAVVCGAGINAVGVGPDGRVARFPALGLVSGDWGGGLGLGEEVLWHAVRAEDGRGPATALAELVRGHFGTGTVEDVVLGLHVGELQEADLMDLSPGLFAVAAQGDAIAESLVRRQAEEVV
ncbi:MAG: ATPase, partial [Nonomuraea sp.]|nr:ATPase [Nonomuraea sp.]